MNARKDEEMSLEEYLDSFHLIGDEDEDYNEDDLEEPEDSLEDDELEKSRQPIALIHLVKSRVKPHFAKTKHGKMAFVHEYTAKKTKDASQEAYHEMIRQARILHDKLDKHLKASGYKGNVKHLRPEDV